MMRSNSCPKCHGGMAEGYVVAEKQGMRGISSWMAGAPIRGWFGIKASGKPIEIATWRCGRCGYLENYARG